MSLLGRAELRMLVQNTDDFAVSFYLPTQRTGEVTQGAMRLKNLLRTAEERLQVMGLRRPDALRLLERAQSLVDETLFWHHQADALALFASQSTFTHFRLPYSLDEMVVVGTHFHLSPLLPLFSTEGVFFVLGLSQKKVRLIECSRDGSYEMTPDSLPSSLADVLQYDEFSKNIQFRSGPSLGAAGRGSAIYHGHGAGKDSVKDNISRFLREVDRGLRQALKEERAPLILAGVGYLRVLYSEINSYPHLLPEGIDGNPDVLNPVELQRQAWPLVAEYFAHERKKALDQYNEAAARGLTINRLEDMVLAAHDGRIAIVFAGLGIHRWGQYDFERRHVEVHESFQPGDEDLMDAAVIQSMLMGASAYVLPQSEMPGGESITATLRY